MRLHRTVCGSSIVIVLIVGMRGQLSSCRTAVPQSVPPAATQHTNINVSPEMERGNLHFTKAAQPLAASMEGGKISHAQHFDSRQRERQAMGQRGIEASRQRGKRNASLAYVSKGVSCQRSSCRLSAF